ncbi:flagellar hook-length control protein FliK [Burkholderia ubonensis]|uniref:flagellar hook-length control protein FliK n=1 Tax=Burkholderia ubonensis TaxID=101571 RepID=UPI000ABD8940|nr:flagellar hook-length control protein FliK [Burkholderia ubonensis]
MGNDSVEIQDQGVKSASNGSIDGVQNGAAANGGVAQVDAPRAQPAALTEQVTTAPLTTSNANGDAPASQATQATSEAESGTTGASTGTLPSNTQAADTQSSVGQDSRQSQSDNASSEQPSLDCRFCGLDGEPIAGAHYRFLVDGNDISGTTDSSGNTPTLQNLKPESDCKVFIKRDDGTFKQVAAFVVPSTSGYVTLMSPSVLLEGQSEQHGGNHDDVYKEPDPVGSDKAATNASATGGNANDRGSSAAGSTNTVSTGTNVQQGNPGANSAPAQSSQPKPAQTPPAPHPSSAAQATKPSKSAAASTALKGGTGKAPQAKAVQTKRDHLSHPQAKPSHDSTDWLDQKIMATWHYIENLFGVKANPVMAVGHGDTPAASAKLAAAAQPSATAAGGDGPYTALVQVAEEQTAHYLPSEHTVDNLSQLSKGTFKYSKDKPVAKSISDCYLYVKVALWRAKYVNSALPGVYAKVAGPFLEQAGFKNVMGEMPDARWALPGDIIVYKLHGDENPTVDNKKPAGHIDIRTYHHYISDFRRNHLFFHGHGTFYEVSGVYRKPGYSDPSVTARVKAFLKVIRSKEASTLFEHYGDKATYGAVYGGLKLEDCIKDFSTHPFANKNVDHSPAGAYQITKGTWASGWKDNGMPRDFSPATQDRYALWIMEMQWEKSGDQSSQTALGYVRLGDLDNAVRLLRSQWAFLPGAGQSRGYTMDQLKADFNKFLKEYM